LSLTANIARLNRDIDKQQMVLSITINPTLNKKIGEL